VAGFDCTKFASPFRAAVLRLAGARPVVSTLQTIMIPMTHDFLLGEPITRAERLRRRRQRDGLCVNCRRPSVKGGRCFQHYLRNIMHSRVFRQKNALRSVNTTA
jgi:hypothetical protein